MKGFVLAAGFGSRLKPITEWTPKALLPIGNSPLIGYSLRLLSHYGINEVAVNVHHLGRVIQESLGDGSAFETEITFSEEDEILGTGGGVRKMNQFLDETFVLINSDILVDIDLQHVIDCHRESGALATMVLRPEPPDTDFGSIEIDEAGYVRRILGKGADGAEQLRSFMFTGVHVIEPRFLEYLPPDIETCIIRYGYTKALQNDERLLGYVHDGYWADAGTPNRYLAANRDALERVFNPAHLDPLSGFALEPRREVAEVVRMGNDVALGQQTNVVPPVLLGEGVRVGDQSTVGPHSVVGANVVIGKDCKLSRCVVLPGTKISAGTRLEDCLVHKKGTLQDS